MYSTRFHLPGIMAVQKLWSKDILGLWSHLLLLEANVALVLHLLYCIVMGCAGTDSLNIRGLDLQEINSVMVLYCVMLCSYRLTILNNRAH
jgi:hypothetical protein